MSPMLTGHGHGVYTFYGLTSSNVMGHQYKDCVSLGNKLSLHRLYQSVVWCLHWKQSIIIQTISVSCLVSALEINHHYTDYISQLSDVCIGNKPSLYRLYQSVVCIGNKPSLYRLYQSVAWCLHWKQIIIIQIMSISCLMSALETNHHYTDYVSQLPDVCIANKSSLYRLYQSVAWCLHWKQTIIIETISVSCLHWKQTINLQIISVSCLMSVFETNHYYPDIISQLSDVCIGNQPLLSRHYQSVVWCLYWKPTIII